MNKKHVELGMNPSTAAHRLRVDLLFMFAKQLGHKCFHCGGELDRKTFSIEHKSPWLGSANPVEMFFDLENIAFSHVGCNSRHKRHPRQKYFSEEEKRAGLLRVRAEWKRKNYSAEKRAEKFKKNGT